MTWKGTVPTTLLVTHFTDETTEPQRGGSVCLRVTHDTAKTGTEARTSALDFSALLCGSPYLPGGYLGLGMLSSPDMVFPGALGSPGLDAGWLGEWVGIQFPASSRGLVQSAPQFPSL